VVSGPAPRIAAPAANLSTVSAINTGGGGEPAMETAIDETAPPGTWPDGTSGRGATASAAAASAAAEPGGGAPGAAGTRSPAVGPRPVATTRAALVERARSGDRLAFERLVEPWIEPAYHTGLAILGRDADARDATQDALLDAWRNIRGLREPERFDAWLGRIHVNACRAIGRRRGRSQVREIRLDVLPDPDATPSRATRFEDQSASLDELERAFDRLSVANRTILVLHYMEERPLAEVADILHVASGTVKWRLHEARGALARALREERR
jgi:RNA polymerase sigma-70 factor, ECF subfamily